MALKQLGAADVDGSINLINTPILVYTVPGGAQALMSNISICNRNATVATGVWLWVVANGGSPVGKNAILPGIDLAAKGTIQDSGQTLEAGGKVYFQSHVTNVNCVISGDEK